MTQTPYSGIRPVAPTPFNPDGTVDSQGMQRVLDCVIDQGGADIEGPFDGEEAITLLADLDAGATGTMTSAMNPDLIGPVVRDFLAGRRQAAMVKGGVIASDFCGHPIPPLHPDTRAMLLELLRPRDPLALRWGRG